MVKIPVFLKLIYKFNTISITILDVFFVVINKFLLKFIWNLYLKIAKPTLKNNKVGTLTLHDI